MTFKLRLYQIMSYSILLNLDVNSIKSYFSILPSTFMSFWNPPKFSLKNRKECRWCALSAALLQKKVRWPSSFYFVILITTMLPFNEKWQLFQYFSNSMTSGGGSSITHSVRAWKIGRHFELPGPRAFAKRAGVMLWGFFWPVGHPKFLQV